MRIELLKLQHDLRLTTIYVTHDQEEAGAFTNCCHEREDVSSKKVRRGKFTNSPPMSLSPLLWVNPISFPEKYCKRRTVHRDSDRR